MASLNPKADPWSPIIPMLPHFFCHPQPPFSAALNLPPPPPPPPPAYLFTHPMQLYNINTTHHQNTTTTFYCHFQHPQPLYLSPCFSDSQKITDFSYHVDQLPETICGSEKMDLFCDHRDKFSWANCKKVKTFEKEVSFYKTPPRFRKDVPKVWKKWKKVKDNNLVESSESSIAGEDVINFGDDGEKTSVMIRNIPNKFRREELLQFLDLCCIEHQLEYDFVYLPMDFMRHNNYGYAFVNFTTSNGAYKIMSLLDGHKWSVSKSNLQMSTSKKICQMNWARIQGKEELVKHFQQSKFSCDLSEYLPVVFSPPRNGSTSISTPSTIGKLGGNPPQKRT